MSEVVATAERGVHAPVERVRAALADYEGARRRALPEQFTDYRVEAGGRGAGTRVHWRFGGASQRGRDPLLVVPVPTAHPLLQARAHFSAVTPLTAAPPG